MSSEFRRFTRRDSSHRIDVLDMMTRQLMGSVVNISEYGMMLAVHVPLCTDAIYQCEIHFPAEYNFKAPFVVGIQELWSEPVTAGGITCAGFRIIDIDKSDRQQISDWVNEQQQA